MGTDKLYPPQRELLVALQQFSWNHHRTISQILIVLLSIIYIKTCPYNKVEESFNIQAAHDIYYYGIPPIQNSIYRVLSMNSTTIPLIQHLIGATTTTITTNTSSSWNETVGMLPPYDHLQYPGVVPRTFLGPFIVGGICYVIRCILYFCSLSHVDISNRPYLIQFLSRIIVLFFNLSQLFNLVSSVDRFVGAAVVSPTSTSTSARSPPTLSSSSEISNATTTSKPTTTILGTYMIMITGCQFHLIYYYSRMLPNTFACIATLRCYMHWINALCLSTKNSNIKVQSKSSSSSNKSNNGSSEQLHLYEMTGAVVDLLIATLIFRCDCILLLFTIGLTWIVTKQLSIVKCITIGSTVSIVLLTCITIPLDSLFWQRFVWPEGEVLYYNTILNKSSNWGVGVWHWYFTSALPKAILLPVLFVPLSFMRIPETLSAWERSLRFRKNEKSKISMPISKNNPWLFDVTYLQFLLPAFGFVALYSNLGHKEVRFLYPVLPLFNLCAAVGLHRIHEVRFPIKDKLPTMISKALYIFAILALVVSFVASGIFVAISRYNYPGGKALELLTQHVNEIHNTGNNGHNKINVKVHIDVASAMTGVNLFGQRAASVSNPNVAWTFDKDGYEIENDNSAANLNWGSYTHMLSESKDITQQSDDFIVVDVAQGNPRLDIKRGRILTSDAIYVLGRKDWIDNNR